MRGPELGRLLVLEMVRYDWPGVLYGFKRLAVDSLLLFFL